MDKRAHGLRRSLHHLAAAKAKLEDGRIPLLAIELDLLMGCFGTEQIGWSIHFHKYFEKTNTRDLLTSTDRAIKLVADALPGYVVSTNTFSAAHTNCFIAKTIATPPCGYGAHEYLPCAVALALVGAIQSDH
jgi:hypothetical protein